MYRNNLVWSKDLIQSNGTVNFPTVGYFLNTQWVQLGPGYLSPSVKCFKIVPSLLGDMIARSKRYFSVLVLFDFSTTANIAKHPFLPDRPWHQYVHLLPCSSHRLQADGFWVLYLQMRPHPEIPEQNLFLSSECLSRCYGFSNKMPLKLSSFGPFLPHPHLSVANLIILLYFLS